MAMGCITFCQAAVWTPLSYQIYGGCLRTRCWGECSDHIGDFTGSCCTSSLYFTELLSQYLLIGQKAGRASPFPVGVSSCAVLSAVESQLSPPQNRLEISAHQNCMYFGNVNRWYSFGYGFPVVIVIIVLVLNEWSGRLDWLCLLSHVDLRPICEWGNEISDFVNLFEML